MKNAFFVAAATLYFLFSLETSANAQRVTTWKGGTPGRTNDWTCAKNWKEGRVPDEFSNVFIAQSDFQPIIKAEVEGVNSLTIQDGMQLRIEKVGKLEVFETPGLYGNSSIESLGMLIAPSSEDNTLVNKQFLASAHQ